MRVRAQQAWKLRWFSILGCASARAVAGSLLGLWGHGGADGAAPHLHEVEGDFRGALRGDVWRLLIDMSVFSC